MRYRSIAFRGTCGFLIPLPRALGGREAPQKRGSRPDSAGAEEKKATQGESGPGKKRWSRSSSSCRQSQRAGGGPGSGLNHFPLAKKQTKPFPEWAAPRPPIGQCSKRASLGEMEPAGGTSQAWSRCRGDGFWSSLPIGGGVSRRRREGGLGRRKGRDVLPGTWPRATARQSAASFPPSLSDMAKLAAGLLGTGTSSTSGSWLPAATGTRRGAKDLNWGGVGVSVSV